jgi:CheY-like chemotaxis protein
MTWKAIKDDNKLAANSAGSDLTVALVGRVGQPDYMALLRIADLVNLMLKDMPELSGGVNVVRVDAGEDTSIIREMNLKYLPTFLAFKKGVCIYSGQFGGQKVQSFAASARPQVLVVESNPKHQMAMEKTLKKLNCDMFLCLSAADALQRLRQVSRSSGAEGKSQLVFDVVLLAHDLGVAQAQDMGALGKQLEQYTSINRTVVAATVDMLGTQGHANIKAVSWSKNFSSTETGAMLQQPLINFAKTLVQKPIKARSIQELISKRTVGDGGGYLGMTPSNFIAKLKELKEKAVVPQGTDIMRLTVQDTHVGGPEEGRALCA